MSACGKKRQKDLESKGFLCYIVKLCFKTPRARYGGQWYCADLTAQCPRFDS
jgi:hypothetical protein